MSNLLDDINRQYHVRNPVILGNETTVVSFTETEMFNIMRLCVTDHNHDCFLEVRLERKEYLQIIKHGIQQFGFTEEELRDGQCGN